MALRWVVRSLVRKTMLRALLGGGAIASAACSSWGTYDGASDAGPYDGGASNGSSNGNTSQRTTLMGNGTVTSADGFFTITFLPGSFSGNATIAIDQIGTGMDGVSTYQVTSEAPFQPGARAVVQINAQSEPSPLPGIGIAVLDDPMLTLPLTAYAANGTSFYALTSDLSKAARSTTFALQAIGTQNQACGCSACAAACCATSDGTAFASASNACDCRGLKPGESGDLVTCISMCPTIEPVAAPNTCSK